MILNLIFLTVAALATGGLYWWVDSLSPWWILPILVGNFVAAIFVFLIGLLLVSIIFLPKRKKIKRPKKACAFMIRIVMDWGMRLCRVRVTLSGAEKLPEEPAILVSNHISDFDPMTMLGVLKGKKIAYISKEANLKIPIVGNFIHHAGFLAIDRGNGMRALRTLKEAAGMVKTGTIDLMGIYPEGTRSKSGELLRFKPGAFLLAKRAEAPIVVMTTRGTNKLSKNFPFRTTRVELRILDVIDRDTVMSLEQDEISARVRAMIEEDLAQ